MMTTSSDVPPLRASLLGPVRVAVGERTLADDAWPRRSARSLLLLLLFTPGHQLGRDRVLDLLWPDADPNTADAALRKAVHALRRVLEPELKDGRASRYVETVAETVALRPASGLRIDVDAFETALAAAHNGSPAAQRARLREALALYRGHALADELAAEWADGRREGLRNARRQAALALARLEIDDDEPLAAVAPLEALLVDDPSDEVALRTLLRALTAGGQRDAALRRYDQAVAALRADLDVDPSAETRALVAEIRAAAPAPAAAVPPRPPSPRRYDVLPAPPNALIGRARELEAVLDLLWRAETRVVTLIGPGGIGKTRLALEVAAQAAPDFAGGVCFVPLAPIRDHRLVLPAVARALGVDEIPGRPIDESLRTALSDIELLLVLDNVEQVIEVGPAIAALLAGCPLLKVLATSREPLRVQAERQFPTPPLAVPPLERDRQPNVETVARYEAVALFVERARAVRPDFALTEATTPAVAEICARLDGLPLAIELAAARAKVLPLDTLSSWMDQRLALLTEGARDLPARLRTMRDAISWSYDLLTPSEQALFRRLAVFVSGCTVDAAESVAEGGRRKAGDDGASASRLPPSVSVLDGLTSLVDKSLVQRVDGAGEVRFGMLETIREYGLERLAADGEEADIRRAHAAWFLALAERAEPELVGPDQARWYDRLDAEHPNLREALAWGLSAAGADDTAIRLAAALWRFWWSRGLVPEGRDWLMRALARPGETAPGVRAKAFQAAAELAEALADYDQARAWHEAALRLWQGTGDVAGQAACLNGLGILARTRGELDQANELHQGALALLREIGDRRQVASTLNNLGAVAYYQGDAARAERLWEETLEMVRAIGDDRSIGLMLGNLGALALMRGDPHRALTLHEESLAVARRLDDLASTEFALVNLGGALFELGDLARATEVYHEALALSRQIRDERLHVEILFDLGKIAARSGDFVGAAELFGESLGLAYGAGNKIQVAACLDGLAGLSVARGNAERGARLFGAAGALRAEIGSPRETVDQPAYDRDLAAIRAALEPDSFDAAWAAGQALALDDAVAEALAWNPD